VRKVIKTSFPEYDFHDSGQIGGKNVAFQTGLGLKGCKGSLEPTRPKCRLRRRCLVRVDRHGVPFHSYGQVGSTATISACLRNQFVYKECFLICFPVEKRFGAKTYPKLCSRTCCSDILFVGWKYSFQPTSIEHVGFFRICAIRFAVFQLTF
jgi:hypothetical protein